MSTHTLTAVETVADRVTVLRSGRIVADGSVAEIKGAGNLEEAFLELTEPGSSG